jgi:hypothetical protein
MRRWSLVLAVALLAAPAVAISAGSAGADVNPPTVTLLDAGDGAKKELRYDLEVGEQEDLVLVVTTRISQKVGSQPPRSGSSPRVEFTVPVAVTDVAADGVITATYSYADVEVGEGPSSSQAEEQLEEIIGLEATFTMTPRGEVLESVVDVPSGLDPTVATLVDQLSQQASQLSVPLPEEPVAVGARWKADATVTVSGITLDQTAEYELLSRKGTTFEVAITIEQSAENQTFTDPATGRDIELISSDGEGDGHTTFDLTKVAPKKADTHVKVRQKLESGGSKLTQTVLTHQFINPPNR